MKTVDLQDIFYTKFADGIIITIKKSQYFVPVSIPSVETETMFIESSKNTFTISFYSWYTERKVVDDGVELQIDIGSAHNNNSPKYLIAAHQSLARIVVAKKQSN